MNLYSCRLSVYQLLSTDTDRPDPPHLCNELFFNQNKRSWRHVICRLCALRFLNDERVQTSREISSLVAIRCIFIATMSTEVVEEEKVARGPTLLRSLAIIAGSILVSGTLYQIVKPNIGPHCQSSSWHDCASAILMSNSLLCQSTCPSIFIMDRGDDARG